ARSTLSMGPPARAGRRPRGPRAAVGAQAQGPLLVGCDGRAARGVGVAGDGRGYARHVLAAERRRLADGRHHLHLAELDVRRVGVIAREGPAEGAPRIETEVAAG